MFLPLKSELKTKLKARMSHKQHINSKVWGPDIFVANWKNIDNQSHWEVGF